MRTFSRRNQAADAMVAADGRGLIGSRHGLGDFGMSFGAHRACDAGQAEACSEPSKPARKTLVLITTILASSLSFIDGSVVNVGLPRWAAPCTATRGAAVGDQRLPPAVERALVAGRRARGPVRTPATFGDRRGHLRPVFARLRAGPYPALADRGAGRARRRRGAFDAQQSGHPRRRLFGRGAGARDRDLGGDGIDDPPRSALCWADG